MKKLSALQENSERQFSGPRNKINNKQEEYFTNSKKNQTEVLELKNSYAGK